MDKFDSLRFIHHFLKADIILLKFQRNEGHAFYVTRKIHGGNIHPEFVKYNYCKNSLFNAKIKA